MTRPTWLGATSERPQGRIAVALLAAVALAAVVGPTPAHARQPAASILQLVEQTAFVEPEGEFDVRLRATGAPPDARLRTVVHDRVRTRTEFVRSVAGEGLRRALLTSTQDLTDLAVDASGTLLVRVPVRSTGSDTSRLRIAAGVYPVELVLVDDRGSPVDRLVTHLVRLPDTGDESPPLSLALVLPLHGGPALRADGTTALDDRSRANLAVEVAALLNHPALPLTAAPTPEVIDALAEGTDIGDEGLLANLREALAGRLLLASPYVRVAASGLVREGLDDLLADEIRRGSDVLTDQIGEPLRSLWVAEDLDGDTAVELERLGVDAMVVPEAALDPLDEKRFPVTLTQTFELDAGGRRIHAAMVDAGLAAHLDESGDSVLDAHVLLADIATLYFDAPTIARGAVFALPTGWTPDPDFLDELLGGLAPNALLQPVDLATFFGTVPTASARGPNATANPPAEPLIRPLVETPAIDLGGFPAALAAAQRDIETYRSMIGAGSPRADPLDERVLVSASADLAPDQRVAYLDAVRQAVAAEAAKVETQERQTITLTARKGRVPLLIRNRAGYPLNVVVRLDSDRLAFPANPDGRLDLVLTEEITRIDVEVRVRSSGDSPLDIVVTSPDGRRALSRVRYRVRSTAVSGLGVGLSIGAGLFLLFWWAGTARRSRRRRLGGGRSPTETE